MNIQPLMYFNLENVPFFNGAYLITSVNHSISPNHMTTNFTGVRQSKYITKFNSKVVADLNLNLNETNEIPKLEFTNRLTTNPIWKIGVKSPQDGFEFNTKWKVSKFEEMGVDFNNVKGLESKTDDEIQTILDLVKKEMDAYEIVTNSQVCMFVANVMVQSNYLANEESTLSKGDLKRAEFPKIGPNVTIYSGATRIYGDTTTQKPANYPFNDELLDTLVNNPSGILNSTPTFTAETADDIAWVSKTSSEYEEHQTFQANRAEAYESSQTPAEKVAAEKIFQGQLSGLTYYNIYPGDGWRFKPRGYLHVTGRREYFEYGDDYLKSPDKIVSSFLESFKAAMHVWKTKKPTSKETLKGPYKNSYEAAGGDGTDKKRNGSSSDFTLTNEISCEPDTAIGESFDAFESVLLAFNLKDEFNPV
jgi:predicted chitinase